MVELKSIATKDVRRLTEAFRIVGLGMMKGARQFVDLLVILVVLAAIVISPHLTYSAAHNLFELCERMVRLVVQLMMALLFVGLFFDIIGRLIRKALLEVKSK
jgi:uncharacterized sodium:solute symporter family permease YidK